MRATILVVEDHPLVLRLVASAVESLGHIALTAESADEAKRRMEQGLLPSLVLSDIRMPGEIDGLDLAQWIRVHRPGLPVILQTAYAEIEVGDIPVLRKPFTVTELSAALSAFLIPASAQLSQSVASEKGNWSG